MADFNKFYQLNPNQQQFNMLSDLPQNQVDPNDLPNALAQAATSPAQQLLKKVKRAPAAEQPAPEMEQEPYAEDPQALVEAAAPTENYQPEDYVDPNGLPNSISQQINTPERQAMIKDLQLKSQQALDQEKEGISKTQGQLDKYGSGIDFTPLAAMVDNMTGSNYTPAASNQADKITALRNAIQSQKQGLTKDQISLLKDQLSGMNPLAVARLQQRGQTVGLAQDRAAAQAVKDIDNHPLMIETDRQFKQMSIDSHTLENSPVITSQMLRELSNGVGNALAGGKGIGVESGNTQDMSTALTSLAKWESYLSNNPKNAASPQVRAQILTTVNRLRDAFGGFRADMAQKLAQGRTYDNNPQAQRSVKTAVGKYAYTPTTPKQKIKVSATKNSGPKAGTIEDGHKFLGGDPSDPKNWEQQ